MFGFPGRFARSEEERLARHRELFGTDILPPRGTGVIRDLMKKVAIDVIEKTTLPLRLVSAPADATVREVIHKIKFSNPEPISREEAIEAIAESKWAQHWAEGMARLAGLTPASPEWEETIERLSRRVAESVVSV